MEFRLGVIWASALLIALSPFSPMLVGDNVLFSCKAKGLEITFCVGLVNEVLCGSRGDTSSLYGLAWSVDILCWDLDSRK